MGPFLKDEGDGEDGLVGGDLEMVGRVFPPFWSQIVIPPPNRFGLVLMPIDFQGNPLVRGPRSEAGLLNKRLMLSSSFRCDQINKYKIYDFGHTLLCYLNRT